MAQVRLAAAVATAILAMSTLAVTGCSSRDLGSNVRGEAPSGGEMVADAAVSRPMTLWASAIGAIGWVVTLPFTLPADDVDKVLVGDSLEDTFCHPVGEIDDTFDKPCIENEG